MTVTTWEFHKEDEAAINDLLSAMRTDLFESESERKAAVFALARERQRNWQAVHECSFPGCQEPSIQRSHTLSRALMIQPISEGNHVLGLNVDLSTANYRMRSISINEASTFPGFCEVHENEFEFEAEGAISNGRQLQRHLFRNICRHIYFLKHEKHSLSRYLDEMKSKAVPLLDSKLKETNWKSDTRMVRAYVLEDLFGNLELIVAQRSENIDFDIQHWFHPHAANFGRYPGEFGFHDELIQCPNTPVSIATAMLFADVERRSDGTPDFTHQYYVSVFPNAGAAHIHLTALEEQRDRLVELADRFSDGVEATRIIQMWLQNSDHWYMQPSAWESLDKDVKDSFLDNHTRIALGGL